MFQIGPRRVRINRGIFGQDAIGLLANPLNYLVILSQLVKIYDAVQRIIYAGLPRNLSGIAPLVD